MRKCHYSELSYQDLFINLNYSMIGVCYSGQSHSLQRHVGDEESSVPEKDIWLYNAWMNRMLGFRSRVIFAS